MENLQYMIRVLHTADWHIGHTFFGYDRTAEHLHFFEWLNGQLAANRVDALLVAGDVFDTINPSAASQKMLFNFIRNAKKANPDLQMVLIAGSHDSAGRLEAPMPLLEDMNVTVKGQLMKVKDEPIFDDMIVPLKGDSGETEALCLLLPHIYQTDYSNGEDIGDYYTQLLRRTTEIKESGQAIVVLGYLNVAENPDGEAVKVDIFNELRPVSSGIFDDSVQYVGLGHKHHPHTVDGRKYIRYAGSPLPMTFEERNMKRSCTLLTMPDKDTPIIEELEYKPMTQLLSIPEDAPRAENEIMQMLSQLPDKGADAHPPFLEVRVLISDPDPLLRMRIEEALDNKAVRLARIITVFQSGKEQYTEEEIMTAGLRDMSPLQIARITYEKVYQEEMPSDLEELFTETCATIN